MQRSKRICGFVALIAATGWAIYDWVWVNEGPAYFASDWRPSAFLLGISILGGFTTYLASRMAPAVRHRITALLFGFVSIVTLYCAGYAIVSFVRLYSFLAEMRVVWAAALAAALVLVFAILASLSFVRYYRRTYATPIHTA